MNVADLDLLEAIRLTLAQVAGLRTVRLVRTDESVEVPLSRLPAAVLEPCGAEDLAWPEAPTATYHLVHWRARVLDRAVPGSRAFESLVSLAEVCRDTVEQAPLLGGKAEDGPPSERDASLRPAVGATRLGPLRLSETVPGRPTALAFAGASGYWIESMVGAATFDDEALFASGPHVVLIGSPARRVVDQVFNGLAGGLALDLGDGPRDIHQTGVLSAGSAPTLAAFEAAIETLIDGRAYTLITPEGAACPNCRLERFDRLGPPRIGTEWHQPYKVTYRQLAR